MIRAFRHFKKKLSFIKHEKLSEDSGQDPIVEGVTFYVRYLGSCFVINKAGDEATSEAIKSIVSMARKTDRKLNRVALLVSVKDVKMTDLETGNVCFDISIYRISYCCADALFSHVFAFITVNKDDTMECHAFLCRKRKIAQAASMTVAQAFNLAFASWKDSQERRKSVVQQQTEGCDICLKDEKNCEEDRTETDSSEKLLIDLSSPGDTLTDKSFPHPANTPKLLIKIDSKDTDIFDEDMDKSFSALPATPCRVPILQRLPANSISMDMAAFISSPTLFDEPLEYPDSPQYGSCLTPSQLYTPASSPIPTPRQQFSMPATHDHGAKYNFTFYFHASSVQWSHRGKNSPAQSFDKQQIIKLHFYPYRKEEEFNKLFDDD